MHPLSKELSSQKLAYYIDNLKSLKHTNEEGIDLIKLENKENMIKEDSNSNMVESMKREQKLSESSTDRPSDDEESNDGKPNHSYISLIANAILSSRDKRLVLNEIYNYVLENHAYYRNKGQGWRNSIRHNLSLNECFIKAGRSPNGKGHYWAINPVNYENFSKGDFRKPRHRTTPHSRGKMLYGDFVDFYPYWSPYHPYISSMSRHRYRNSPIYSPNSSRPTYMQPRSSYLSLCKSLGCVSPPLLKKDEVVEVKKSPKRFDIESLLREDDKPTSNIPAKICKRPSSIEIALPLTPINYRHDHLHTTFPERHTPYSTTYHEDSKHNEISPSQSLGMLSFERYRNFFSTTMASTKTHHIHNEQHRLSLVQ